MTGSQNSSPAVPEYIQAWADEITRMEGWIPAGTNPSAPRGSLSWRHLNPGNLVANGTYRVFASYDAGRAALCEDLTAKCEEHPLWTLQQAMNVYCPAPNGAPMNRGNQPDKYAMQVADALGVMPATELQDLATQWEIHKRQYVPAAFAH